jgi:hypothetical protein
MKLDGFVAPAQGARPAVEADAGLGDSDMAFEGGDEDFDDDSEE